MSRHSLRPPRGSHAHGRTYLYENQGTRWIGSFPEVPRERIAEAVGNGCIVVRRIIDDRGREWRVRQLWSERCHGLLFQCSVRGVRSEIRPMRGPLEALTDEELLIALAPADD